MQTEDKIYSQVYKRVTIFLKKRVGNRETDYVLDTLGRGERFLKSICLLPIWFSQSFGVNQNLNTLSNICEANFKAWIAYTLFDYLRDGKIKDKKSILCISIANICIRDAIETFQQYANTSTQKKYVFDLLNTIDQYYIDTADNEIRYIRSNITFSKLSNLVYKKSIAACLAAILMVPNNKNHKLNCDKTIHFFRYYFNARQLSDDLDDFRKDLSLNILTPATLLLTQKYSESNMHSKLRSKIDTDVLKAIKSLKSIEKFDYEYFSQRYIKKC